MHTACELTLATNLSKYLLPADGETVFGSVVCRRFVAVGDDVAENIVFGLRFQHSTVTLFWSQCFLEISFGNMDSPVDNFGCAVGRGRGSNALNLCL